MISLNTVLAIVCFMFTVILYILLGINDFQPHKKQLFALIPLLLLLLTLYRMNNIPPVIYDSVKNTYKTLIQSEEIVESNVPITAIQSKPIEIVEKQMQNLQVKDHEVKIPVEIKKEIKVNNFATQINKASESLPFITIMSLLSLGLNLQVMLQ